jgi:hypothetical protein
VDGDRSHAGAVSAVLSHIAEHPLMNPVDAGSGAT